MDSYARDRVAEPQRPRAADQAVGAAPSLRRIGNQVVASLLRASSGGRPLDPGVRRELEEQLGTDLRHVRVHTGPAAASAADALRARAFTVGHHLVFGAGEYRPHDPAGRALLAHEATHARQQAQGGTAPAGSPDAERAATVEAGRVEAGDRTPSPAVGTATGIARQPKEGADGAAPVPDDSLGAVGDVLVEIASQGVAGSGLRQRMLKAAMRGFVAETGRQLKPGEQVARFKSSLRELAVPSNLGQFVKGYQGGALAGLVSPATDLLGLGALMEQLPAIAVNLGRRVGQQAATLVAEAQELAKHFAQFSAAARDKITELLRDPAQLDAVLEAVGSRAVAAAGEAGRQAAATIVQFFTGEAKEEQPDIGVGQALGTHTEEERSGPLSFLMSKATRLRKLAFSTPWARFGYNLGHAVGAVISNLLLLIFTEGIGNAITKIAGVLGEVAPLLARGAKALASLGRVIETIETLIGTVLTKGLKLVKPLESVVSPLLRMMERLQSFLRRLFGVAEREAAVVVARGGAAASERLAPGGVSAPVGTAAAKPAAPAVTPAAPAVTPAVPGGGAAVVPLKGPSRPRVSALTRSQQTKLGTAPKGSRAVSELPPASRGSTPRLQAAQEPVVLPQAATVEEAAPLARTGTDDVVSAGAPKDVPQAMAGAGSGSRSPRPGGAPAAAPVRPSRRASGGSGGFGGRPPVRPTRPAPKARPPGRGATAEGEGASFTYEYHDPAPTPSVTRGPVKPAPRKPAEPVAERPAPGSTRETPSRGEEVKEEFEAAAAQASPDEQIVRGTEPGAPNEPVVSPTRHQPVAPSYRASDELAEAMARQGNPRPPGHETHHMVADSDPRAAEARRILKSAGIEPRNDPRNGIHLPRTTSNPRTVPEAYTRHPTLHTDSYYEAVNQRFRDAAAGRGRPGGAPLLDRNQRIEEELAKLYEELAQGQLPHPKKRD